MTHAKQSSVSHVTRKTMRRGLRLVVLPVLAHAMRFSPRVPSRVFPVRMLSTTTAFADLPINDQLKKALNGVGLETATPVQQATLPPLLEGKDVVAKARTGTGKTVAFLVPTLQRLMESKSNDKGQIRALVLSPTRELAAQIAEAAEGLVAGSGLRTACIFGGTSMAKDRRALSGQVDLLVATPGRLWDHMQNERLSPRLAGLQTLILDEGDRLLDQGFSKQIGEIVAVLPRNRQSLCFSATMPTELSAMLGRTLKPEHLVIDCVGAAADDETASRVEQAYVAADMNELPGLAAAVLRKELSDADGRGKIIVFLPTANQAQYVSELLTSMGVPNDPLHSRKSQAFRTRVSTRFRDATSGVIVASDVAARGVDYPDVSLVVQMGAPETREQYIHRTGRTGRAGKAGSAVLLLADWEERTAIGSMLKGLPISRGVEGLAPEVVEAAVAEAAASVGAVEEVTREKAYQAWLGYYKAKMKTYKWNAATLVEYANGFAMGALGLGRVPLLQAKTVGQMGLRGTPGLNVAKGPSGRPSGPPSGGPSGRQPQAGHDNSNRPYSGGRGGGGDAAVGNHILPAGRGQERGDANGSGRGGRGRGGRGRGAAAGAGRGGAPSRSYASSAGGGGGGGGGGGRGGGARAAGGGPRRDAGARVE